MSFYEKYWIVIWRYMILFSVQWGLRCGYSVGSQLIRGDTKAAFWLLQHLT